MNTPLTAIDLPGIPKVRSGKVREVFDLGDSYLLVATDRISAFDCILPVGIPRKGQVLNMISAWWFKRLAHIIPHHMITVDVDAFPPALQPHREQLRHRAMIVRKTGVFPVECVARGYLIGSAWKEYGATGRVCGIPLRTGLQLAERLDEPIFTPATKAEQGHDENISFAAMTQHLGAENASILREATLALYREAAAYAAGRGILLADTKFEFGRDADGRILLIDEALTPDSSRYWPAAGYRPGISPPSFDKQFVRDYLESIPWDKTPPAPPLPEEIIIKTSRKYIEAYEMVTGEKLAD